VRGERDRKGSCAVPLLVTVTVTVTWKKEKGARKEKKEKDSLQGALNTNAVANT